MNDVKWTILDNSNIVESYPGITLPLTYSFIRTAYGGVFKGLIAANLKDKNILAKYDDILDNMITSYEGRVYYCIGNWYSLIDFLPFSKRVIPIWQDMMGVRDKEVYLEKRHDFTFGQKLKMNLNMLKSGLRVPRDMERLNGDFISVSGFFNENYSESLPIADLINIFHELEHRVLDKWYITLANDMYAFIWTGALKHRLGKKGEDVAKYISGIKSLESMKPIKALLDIAKKYGGDEDILNNPAVREYICAYGDRSPCELKLEAMTYREDPSLLERKIREYASDAVKLDRMISNLQNAERPSGETGFLLKRARLGIRNREISRMNRSRIYGMVRRIFLTVGQHLYQAGHIDEPRDVFYLEIDEIEGGDYSLFKHTISQRKAQYAGYERLPARTRLVFRDGTLIDEETEPARKDGFTGVGTSVGSVTAEAVVLHSPDEGADVRDKIIVTKTTDPGWIFLLTMASGIVAEKGSLLSHTAIVSRELGIPAVVAVENATTAIKSGDIVKIDGETGRVEIVRVG